MMNTTTSTTTTTAVGAALIAVCLSACAGGNNDPAPHPLPAGVLVQSVTTYGAAAVTTSDSPATQDLLTAGLGKSGIASATPPGYADKLKPTAAELRRAAIYTAHHLSNTAATAGYGTLFGPNVAIDGRVDGGEGLIPGKEYLAYADDGSGKKNVVLMVQVPANFNPAKSCIVAASSPGSFGVYGAIGMAGQWGLKHGCAVAYTDEGKGVGFHDLGADLVDKIDGQLVSRAEAGPLAHFAADLAGAALAAYNSVFPNRIAVKHFFSGQNPEAEWGKNVLDSIRLAYWVLNEEYAANGKSAAFPGPIDPSNTKVIATGYSNGGGSALRAAEQDVTGLIGGVVATIPNAQVGDMSGLAVNFDGAPVANAGKPFIDYYSYRAIFAPCAAIAAGAQAPSGVRPGWLGAGTAPRGTPATQVGGQELQTVAINRCQSLADKGLVSGATSAEQADSALAAMRAYGFTDPVSGALLAFNYRFLDVISAFGYVTAAGKFSVADNVCGFSLAATDPTGNVKPQPPEEKLLFGQAAATYDVIYNDAVGGAKHAYIGVSPSTGRMDGSLDGELCLRGLATGVDPVSGVALTGGALANSERVRAGVRASQLGGDLRGKPTVLLGGRSDVATPVNHAARAYLALNSRSEGGRSKLRYYEITNVQHLDGVPIAGFDTLFVPLHYYFNNAMDLMWVQLNGGAALPQSQVVRTTPRGGSPGAAPAITVANMPPISAAPSAADVVGATNGSASIPK